MITLKNKIADEKYLSPWMFIIWIVSAVFIILGVFIFYGAQGDVRQNEADILSTRVLDCASNSNLENFNLFSDCNLNQNILENEDYFVGVYLDSKPLTEIGRIAWISLCGVEGEGLFVCSTKQIFIGEQELKVIAGVNQR